LSGKSFSASITMSSLTQLTAASLRITHKCSTAEGEMGISETDFQDAVTWESGCPQADSRV